MTKTVLEKTEKPYGNLFIRHQIWFEIIFVILCGCFYFIWSVITEYNFGPDEYARYYLPQYIFEHGVLPTGDEQEVLILPWGFSYAYYPTFLGPLLSAFFMKVVSLFTANSFAILVGARFVSVLSGVFTVWFVMQATKRLFSVRTKWMVGFLLAAIPQLAFLSSYVNNDMLCVCGSAIICCAWVCGLQDGWNWKNTLMLATGIIIVALSYYNGYSWILCSIVIFFFSYLLKTKNNTDYRRMWKLCGLIVLIVLLFISFFFIRNAVLHDGDFLGLRTIEESAEQNAFDYLKPSNRRTPQNLGMSLWDMFFTLQYTGKSWIYNTFVSFIGVFGSMANYISGWIYKVYFGIFAFGGVCFVCSFIQRIAQRKNYIKEKYRAQILFSIALLISFVIPIVLSIYYSYATDYQSQGRYCYPMIVALMILVGMGMEWFLKWIPSKTVKNIITGCFCFFLTGIALYVFIYFYLPVVT